MNLTDLTTAILKPLERLLKQKEKFLSKVNQIDRRIEGLAGGIGSGGRGRPPGSGGAGRRGGGGHGALKAKVISLLQAAGKEGMHVQELAKKAGVPVPNIRVWFYSTGKKIKEIQQTAKATYSWAKAGASKEMAKAKAKAKAKTKGKPGRKAKSKSARKTKVQAKRPKRAKTVGRKTKAAKPESAAQTAMPVEAL